MIQSLDPARENFLANLELIQRRIANDQTQLSSGYRINKASDSPGEVGDVVQLSSDVARALQVQKNLQTAQGTVSTAQSVLQSATQLLDQIRSEGAQGAGSTQTAAARSVLATEIAQQLSQLVDISRTTYGGIYVFSGDNPNQPQYQVDTASATGVDRLFTTQATTLAQDVNGVSFLTGKTAQDIFDHRNPDDSLAPDNVFSAVNSLQIALANNNTAGITSALNGLQTASDYLNQQLGFYGAVQNRLDSSLANAQQVEVQWQTSLGKIRDTDVAAVSTDMTAAETNQQAALAAQGQMPRQTLFEFLSG
ncbi:MAG: hypothetical protein LAO79_09160 [Acidobacteriia bacterium]|nr:hypothetical protein [Terriglobia bacterium]